MICKIVLAYTYKCIYNYICNYALLILQKGDKHADYGGFHGAVVRFICGGEVLKRVSAYY